MRGPDEGLALVEGSGAAARLESVTGDVRESASWARFADRASAR